MGTLKRSSVRQTFQDFKTENQRSKIPLEDPSKKKRNLSKSCFFLNFQRQTGLPEGFSPSELQRTSQ